MMKFNLLIAAASLMLITACTEQSPTDQSTDEADMDMTDRSATMRTDALGHEIEQASDDLIERAGISRNDIDVSVAEFVTWGDGSMGCPEDGMNYTMALVPGYRILLMADGQTFHYHGARERNPFFCPAERAGQPRPASDEYS